jgi:hypothetical protein
LVGIRLLRGAPLAECLQAVKEVGHSLHGTTGNGYLHFSDILGFTRGRMLIYLCAYSKHGRLCLPAISYGLRSV